MHIPWKSWRAESPKWLKRGWLATGALVALYIGAIQPMLNARSAAQQSTMGLAEARSTAAWQRAAYDGLMAGRNASNTLTVAEVEPLQAAGLSATIPVIASQIVQDRKMIRTGSMDLIVKTPAETAEKIRALAEHLGGYLETSQLSGGDAASASLTVRVPAERFEEARTEIRKLGLRVENERVDAQDATKQYVDQEAGLRNLRAEETQYLTILKRATTVSDTLEVSEKLSGVRGQIEQQQAEFDALSKQIETVAFTITLSTEADTQVFGFHWRPLYQLKLAARDGLNGLAGYCSVMLSVLFYLPAVLLWMGTILIGLAVGYRILRWAGRVIFARTSAVKAKA